jgi:cysteine desulfuration protein SufE
MDTFSQRQSALLEALALLPSPQERLMWLTQSGSPELLLPEVERVPERRVLGCVSQVWLKGVLLEGRCEFRFAADSALVAGLVRAQVQLATGLPAAEVAVAEFTWPVASGLDRQLSPTRLRGLAAVALAIRKIASYPHDAAR